MRLLFLTLDALEGVGGIQRFNARLIRALAEHSAGGVVDDVVSLSLWDGPSVRAPARVRHRGFGWRKAAFLAGFASALLRDRPDVICWGHVLLLRLLPLGRLLRPQARHVLFVHGVEVWGDPRYRRAPPWERWLVRGVDRVVAVSRTTAERMAAAYGLPAGRFALLPNAVDLSEDAEPNEARARDGEALRILSVTRLSAKDTYKGVDVVLRALALLKGELTFGYTVVGDGELRPRYEEEGRRLGLGSSVRFVGRVGNEELDGFYRSSDVFALPSAGEGFGIVYLEAWTYGLPVVAAAEGGAAEVVTHEKTGLLVEPGSVEGVAEALSRLARDPDLRVRLGAAGRAEIEARYTHAHFRSRLAEILSELTR